MTDLTLLDPEVHSATVNAGKARSARTVRATPEALTSGSTANLDLGDDGVMALAFTNPPFVDVDDGAGGAPDGDFDPPGVSFIVSSPSGAFLD